MPKIIDDVKNMIVQEAKKQVLENGYANMTIRSVAKNCDIAVGTIYNYFSSKDMLAASFMLADWVDALDRMRDGCQRENSPSAAFQCIYEELIAYSRIYADLFRDSAASKSAAGAFADRHKQLRSQIAKLIAPVCIKNARMPSALLADFIAESLLAWSSEGRGFADVDEILRQLFQ